MTRTTSYAQNGEDVVLARAFGGQETGFYVDVGAADPRADSVTKLFYDRGWHGINIEPQEHHFRDLVRERPRDVNLGCGLGAKPGRATFARNCDIPGWSTFSDEFHARYVNADMQLEMSEVEVRTLADVCDEHAPSRIDFLKIDVEGYEYEVLVGGDWERFRPRVVVIEATEPERWEHVLSAARYQMAMFDGLNRFYVPEEDRHLVAPLSSPANIMDNYISWIFADHIATLSARVEELEAEVAFLRAAEPHGAGRRMAARVRQRVAARLPGAVKRLIRQIVRR